MTNTAFLARICDKVQSVIVDRDAMAAYRHDQCLLADAGMPLAVVKVHSVEEVVTTVDLCRRYGVPLVTRGTGTGLSGGANALDGGVVLALDALDRILEIDPAARWARVEPGVINADLDRAAAAHDLWYAPDPGSRAICSVGGNVATNAGGMCCAKYGVTGDHVLALTAVLGTGEVLRTGGTTRKNAAGLDLVRLLVGSEGTLGVIVEATVRLRPRPTGTATVAATFPTVQAAIDTVLELGAGVDAAATEIMDRTTVRAVNAMTRMGLDEDAGAVVLATFDGVESAQQSERCADLAQSHGAETFRTDDPDEGLALMEARRAALPALERMGTVLLDDVCVAVPHLPALIDAIDAIAEQRGVTVGTFGHAADGNLHPTIVFDPSDQQKVAASRAAFDDIVRSAISLGGTASGEHGIGSLKVPYLQAQLDEVERAIMHGVKKVFDPEGVLNPGRGY